MLTVRQRQTLLQQRAVKISCIVPVLDEADGILNFLAALSKQLGALTHDYEIIVVDDGSTDETTQRIESVIDQYHIKLLIFSRNFGKGKAVTAGLDHCKGDVAIIIDADFQHPIDLIPTFLQKWAEGYEVVYGIRKDRKGEGWFRRWTSQAFYRLMEWLTNAHIPLNVVDFRLLDQQVVQALNQFEERDRFMKGLYSWVGFKRIAVPFIVPKRQAGKSSWKLRSLTGLAFSTAVNRQTKNNRGIKCST